MCSLQTIKGASHCYFGNGKYILWTLVTYWLINILLLLLQEKAIAICTVVLFSVSFVNSKPYTGGIIRDIEIPLPSNEKIYKRSVETIPEETTESSTNQPEVGPTEKPDVDSIEEDVILLPSPGVNVFLEPIEIEDDFDGAESGLVFRPLFTYRSQQIRKSRRSGRSIEDSPVVSTRARRSADLDDLGTAESSIVFRPLFRYRYVQRRRASRRRA